MDKAKIERRIARGGARWQASRLKPVVKKRGSQNSRKPKGFHGGKMVRLAKPAAT